MSIHALVTGRLKEPAKYRIEYDKQVRERTTATLIANDSSNRSQKVTLETTDKDIGRALQKTKEGESISVSGELAVIGGARLHMRPRAVLLLRDTALD